MLAYFGYGSLGIAILMLVLNLIAWLIFQVILFTTYFDEDGNRSNGHEKFLRKLEKKCKYWRGSLVRMTALWGVVIVVFSAVIALAPPETQLVAAFPFGVILALGIEAIFLSLTSLAIDGKALAPHYR